LLIGRAFHDLAEEYQKLSEKGSKPTNIDVLVRRYMPKELANDKNQVKDLTVMANRFHRDHPFGEDQYPHIELSVALNPKLEPIEVNKYFQPADPNETRELGGKIDRCYFPAEGADDKGNPRIIDITDWKTSRTEEIEALEGVTQLQFYGWLATKLFPTIEEAVCRYWYARTGNWLPKATEEATFNLEQLQAVEKWYKRWQVKIDNESEWKATPNYRCDWCEFRNMCTAWKDSPMTTLEEKVMLWAQAKAFADGMKTVISAEIGSRVVETEGLKCSFKTGSPSRKIDAMKFVEFIAEVEDIDFNDAFREAAKYMSVDSRKISKWLNDPVVCSELDSISTFSKPRSTLTLTCGDKFLPIERTKKLLEAAPKKKTRKKPPKEPVDIKVKLPEPAPEPEPEPEQPQLPYKEPAQAVAEAHACNDTSIGCDTCKPPRAKADVIGWTRPWAPCPDCGTSCPHINGKVADVEAMATSASDEEPQALDEEEEKKLRRSLQSEVKNLSQNHGLSTEDRMYVMYALTGRKSARGVNTVGSRSLQSVADFLNANTNRDVMEAVEVGKEVAQEEK
jgi:hypothetical protein